MTADCHMHPVSTEDLNDARRRGVSPFLCAATRPDDYDAVLRFANARDDVIPFIGTHPWYAGEHDNAVLNRLLRQNPSAGVGEIGLDGKKGQQTQIAVFKEQLLLAAALNRPAVIHCVKAMNLLAPVLKTLSPLPVMMFHAFAGDANDIRFLTGFNVYFSLNAAHATKFPFLLQHIPPDRLLFDSDAPFMRPKDGFCVSSRKENAPANLSLTVRYAATVLKMSEAALERQTAENIRRFLHFLKDKNDD